MAHSPLIPPHKPVQSRPWIWSKSLATQTEIAKCNFEGNCPSTKSDSIRLGRPFISFLRAFISYRRPFISYRRPFISYRRPNKKFQRRLLIPSGQIKPFLALYCKRRTCFRFKRRGKVIGKNGGTWIRQEVADLKADLATSHTRRRGLMRITKSRARPSELPTLDAAQRRGYNSQRPAARALPPIRKQRSSL